MFIDLKEWHMTYANISTEYMMIKTNIFIFIDFF